MRNFSINPSKWGTRRLDLAGERRRPAGRSRSAPRHPKRSAIVLNTLLFSTALFNCSTADITPEDTDLLLLEEPRHSTDASYVKHYAYSLSYDETTEQAKWIAYQLDSSELVPNCKRIKTFYPDTAVRSVTADNSDYKHSGYDRGHLAPAADMVWDERAMRESFYYSNISPQLPSFNRGIWKALEGKVRKWASECDDLYITCGPLFLNVSTPETIGANKVAIPTHFYKTVLAYRSGKRHSIGFLFPHAKCAGTIFDYAVAVDSIEQLSGLDLYYKLPDKEEAALESKFSLSEWQ